jgi:hypothetical protein
MEKRKMEKTEKFTKIGECPDATGHWAVFRSTVSSPAKFRGLHTSRESAVKEAQRLAAESISLYGGDRVLYYVIFIDAKVGISDGKLHDGAKSLIQLVGPRN